MPYLIGYFLIGLFLIGKVLFLLDPLQTWILCYITIILTVLKKDPLDARIWLFCAWSVIFTNMFSGVRYIPPTINFFPPILYTCFLLLFFNIGFLCNKEKIRVGGEKRIRAFLNEDAPNQQQKIITFFSVCGIIGAIFVFYDIFFRLGLSINGGDRRAEFIENFNQLSFLTTGGMILICGCYTGVLSIFFHGNVINKILGCCTLCALGVQSIAIGGKQGIFLSLIILIFIFTLKSKYKIRRKTPVIVKCILLFVLASFIFYITLLSSERHNNVNSGELLSESSLFSQEFITETKDIIPKELQNTFAEFFGYYGDQLGAFCERWQIEDYPNKYSIIQIPPKFIEPFVWIKRQIVKVFPLYNDIFEPNVNLLDRIANQNKGFYGLANWQTTIRAGLEYFGFLGQILLVFFHGYYSRILYVRFRNTPTYSILNMILFNSLFIVYTTMMSLTGESSALFYLIIILYFRYKEKKQNSIYPFIS